MLKRIKEHTLFILLALVGVLALLVRSLMGQRAQDKIKIEHGAAKLESEKVLNEARNITEKVKDAENKRNAALDEWDADS